MRTMPRDTVNLILSGCSLLLLLALVIMVSTGLASDYQGLVLAGLVVVVILIVLGLLRRSLPWGASPPRQVVRDTSSTVTARLARLEKELTAQQGLQKELVAAKRAADTAVLAKSEFLATMSHEIRTPLNGILPLLDIVLGDQLPPDQRNYLSTAQKSAQELLRIVDDILDYSKVEAGKLELENVSTNVHELVDNLRALMEKPASDKHLSLRTVVDNQVRIRLRGDPVRLRQILTNLISNAIKFTDRGGVSIRVSRRSETSIHQELLFTVRDTGIGIAAAAAAHLFHPFQQADTSITRRYGGTGLGLTICKKLVDLMGGKIGVRSEPNKGSAFWFSVPMCKFPGELGAGHQNLTGLHALYLGSQRGFQQINSLLTGLGIKADFTLDTADTLSRLHHPTSLGRDFSYALLIVEFGGDLDASSNLVGTVLRDPACQQVRVLLPGAPLDAGSERVGVLPREADDTSLRTTLENLFGSINKSRPEPLISKASIANNFTDAPQHGRVLLVEDHPVNLLVARKLLQRLGLKVITAHHGREAVDCFENESFDLILMDCQLPIMDGYAATREIRCRETERKTSSRVSIVAMTAHAMAGDRERCLECGMDDYLSKPLDRGLLARTLKQWLPGNSAGKTVPPTTQLNPRQITERFQSATPRRAKNCVSTAVSSSRLAISPLDERVLGDLEDIMGEELRPLVETFLADTPRRLAQLTLAAQEGNIQHISQQTHDLKSASANLGALPLSALAKTLELEARNGHVDHPAARVQTLKRSFAGAAFALRDRYNLWQ